MKIRPAAADNFPWGKTVWASRSSIIAAAIQPGAAVIDLGGGLCHLAGMLKKPKRYVSIDKKEWTDRTVVADFNAGEFPDIGTFDVAVAQGIIEYVDDPLAFLNAIRKYAPILILTHREGAPDVHTRLEVIDALTKARWGVVFRRALSERQEIFYCRKI